MNEPTTGQLAEIACILEATARKPGNVHPWSSFEDLTYDDFLGSAAAIRPVMDRAVELGLGATVLECIRETRKVVDTNSNLGIVLLLAPLACVPRDRPIKGGITEVLRKTTVEDAETVYEAIRLARPGGLGTVAAQDVASKPTVTLLAAMTAAMHRDLIATQYANRFWDVHTLALLRPASGVRRTRDTWEDVVINIFLKWMAKGDSLIRRKHGDEAAAEAARRAETAWLLRRHESPRAPAAMAELEIWLRGEGRRRNPGTSADLTAATLFVALREGTIRPPFGPIREDGSFDAFAAGVGGSSR